MNLPTHQQCLDFFEEYKVPQNIKEHCQQVNKVAVILAKKLKEAGIAINIDLVDRGSLLHDLFKMAAIKDIAPNQFYQIQFTDEELAMREKLRAKYPGKYENEIAYEEFKDQFPELALTIKHEGDPAYRNKNWEEAVIHYIDMRILKTKLVSLEERFSYFKKRYSQSAGYWDDYLTYCQQEEKRIFNQLSINPENLTKEAA